MDEYDRALCEHYGKMLGLEPGWEVSRVELSTQTMKLELGVEWVNAGAICAECGKKCTRHDLALERRWRHLDAMGFETQIVSRTPRANCGEHGIHQVKVPWAGKHSRFTLAFEALAIKVLQACRSVKAACELLKINWDAAQEIMKRAVNRGKERRVLDKLKAVGLDEKSSHRGQSYVSVLVDLEPGAPRILDVCNGWRKEDAIELLKKLPEPARGGVEAVAMDMGAAYEGAAQAVLPKAEVVFDRFHISKLMGEAMDQVRREEHKKLLSKGDKRLVGTRNLWLYHPDELYKRQKESTRDRVFERLAFSRLRPARAYDYRLLFLEFLEQPDIGSKQTFFAQWYHEAKRSRIEPIKRVAETLKNYLHGLPTYFRHQITNAVTEAHNGSIQALKSAVEPN
jgi:transposase